MHVGCQRLPEQLVLAPLATTFQVELEDSTNILIYLSLDIKAKPHEHFPMAAPSSPLARPRESEAVGGHIFVRCPVTFAPYWWRLGTWTSEKVSAFGFIIIIDWSSWRLTRPRE